MCTNSISKLRVIVLIMGFIIPISLQAQHSHFTPADHTHSDDPRGTLEMDWKLPNITKVVTATWGFSFGIESYPRKGMPIQTLVDGKICQTGSYFSFDVDDAFIYDVDEDITLTLLMRDKGCENFTIAYDKNVQSMAQVFATSTLIGNGWYEAKVVLERARFVNSGHAGTDFTITAIGADAFNLKMDDTHTLTISNIIITRDKKVATAKPKGKLKVTTADENGKIVPARIGIYALENNWMPLPSNKAIGFDYFSDKKNELFLRSQGWRPDYWPSENRHFFYTDGNYTANLPIGKYKMIISKGPEYLISETEFEITQKENTDLKIPLKRWINMPENNWYSGDAHIHFQRTKKINQSLNQIMQAEDVHVSNILEMGNPGGTHFHQYAYGKEGQYINGDHALVSGVEDPRTVHHGHTIALNITKNLHNRDDYFLYHKVLAAYKKQGGTTGYAHVDRDWFNDEGGLALDVPLGVIDFLEIMQYGEMQTHLWYHFLSLGYKLLPIAGSDFPYLDHPGSVRSYVKIDGAFTPENWFKGFKAGNTFVTNGPMLSFSVNDMPMGATLELKKGDVIHVKAEVKNDIQIDTLDCLELVINGEVVKKVKATNGANTITLEYKQTIEKGSWMAVRASGKDRALAHSAATYVHIDASGHLQKNILKETVQEQIGYLETLRDNNLKEVLEIEYHEAAPGINELWLKHKDEMNDRINEAIKIYKDLLENNQP
ncbi:hypothetical protein FNW52_06270 [Flavobacterium sp. ZT3R18]|uniref:CehA/McbA family metallohydrolase n=1 Tax=Flavobacterium sp. ZT3R18 TaxID=2594429 RepID=UPI00117A07F9|nr:CehA/McbA family metallohydrolase [Flavobacterium sp. ZT3R18]TRX36842.1 hypothetical protein FNW52_06270 [Flavobacterium sp. ZT3R18]